MNNDNPSGGQRQPTLKPAATEAETELVEAALAVMGGQFPSATAQERLTKARQAVALERVGPMVPDIRQAIREQLRAQLRLRPFQQLPGASGEGGFILAIWREVEKELGIGAGDYP